MNAKQYLVIGCAGLLAAGCAAQKEQPPSVSVTVPAPAEPAEDPAKGYLQVYSATQTQVIYDYGRHFPHSAYSIFDDSGRLVRTVTTPTTNHSGGIAELQLPPGHYKIVVKTKDRGDVTMPVLIQQGRTALVNLGGE